MSKRDNRDLNWVLLALACGWLLNVSLPAAEPATLPPQDSVPALGDPEIEVVLTPQQQLKLLTQLAFDGDANAQLELAVLYEERDALTNAFRWFEKSANQGNAEAEYKVGVFHALGMGGVAPNAPEAVGWFRKAATQGMSGAQYNLAVCLERGLGVPQDFAQAREWHEKAARQKDTYAQKALGVIYEKGQGVDPNPVEAFAWYHLAAELKNPEAIALRRVLAPRLKPEQVSDGRKRADDLAREIYGVSLSSLTLPATTATPIKDFLE